MKVLSGFASAVLAQQCNPTYEAKCELQSGASGEVTLTQYDCGYVELTGTVNCHAAENCDDGDHGFHVHEASPSQDEFGNWDCSFAGGHFRKEGQEHGPLDAPDRHWGAIGNILIKNGTHTLNKSDNVISLDPEAETYIGERGMVLHALADDFTPPWGNAGPRVACCAITAAKKIDAPKEDKPDEEYVEIVDFEASGAFMATGLVSLYALIFG